ncbi:MAG TPA: ABC transporter permease [Planctomycetota bacterium]|jgi:peptide/nickel transport system permease protein
MTHYVLKRLLLMIPTLIGITFLTYVIIRSAPGTPLTQQIGETSGPERGTLGGNEAGDYRALLHLDKDPVTAYFYWARDFFSPNQNVSSTYKTFVFNVILERLPRTLSLNIFAAIILYVIGLPLGVDSAVHARSVRERVITLLLFLLYSLPSFWVGLNLIVLLGHGGNLRAWLPLGLAAFRHLFFWTAGLFAVAHLLPRMLPLTPNPSPAGGRGEPGRWITAILHSGAWVGVALLAAGCVMLGAIAISDGLSLAQVVSMVVSGQIPGSVTGLPIRGLEPENAEQYTYLRLLRHSIPYYLMPVFCLVYAGLASESRYMRVGLMNVLREDYVRTAKAKGLSGAKVVFRHALPNALTPIIVGLAGVLPGLISGAVIVETLFGIPGMGRLFVDAVFARDYNLIMAEAFIGAVLVLLGILISDLLLPALDPRVSFERS